MDRQATRTRFLSKIEPVDRYRSIFENAIEGIFQTSTAGQYLNVNPALAKMYGYDSPKDLMESLTKIGHQLYVDPLRRDAFVMAMEVSGVVKGFESEIYRKDGSVIWISENARAVHDPTGKIDYYEGMVEDITERKSNEESLKLFRALVNQSNDAIEVIDPQTGRMLDLNERAWQRLGYTREEMLAMSVGEIEDGAGGSLLDHMEGVRSAGYKIIEGRRRRKDGTSFPVEINVQYIQSGHEYLVAVVRDISERKRAEDQISEQAAFLDKARDAIVARDLEGKVLFWNEGAERIYGWKREEILGENMAGILYADPAKFTEVNSQTISKGEWSGELRHLTRSGEEITTEGRCTLIRDQAGQPKSVLAIYTDITEKKQIESQFLRAQRMESIGTLAGGIAHDLNNILTPIMMSIDTLKITSNDPESLAMLETIGTSAKRGADIVRQVLSFARGLEGERIEVQPKHILRDLEHIIRDTFPKNIRLSFTIPKKIWTILGDPTQVHQVLLNLSVNARDAMPEGGNLTISAENAVVDEHYASMHLEAKAGRYVKFSVADSGMGIPQKLVDKIFEPFFTTKQLNKGTGLGLSTVMAIVKSHQGIINVYSEEGKGTLFSVYLPAIEDSSDPGILKSGKLALPRGNGETILVIDDETSILTITSQTLQAFGYRVLTATDGARAIAAYLEHRNEIAVVLTDMMMPVMDGPATIHALRSMNPTLKIIAASGLSANSAMVQPTGENGVHFLTKPYTAGALLKALREVLVST